MVLVLGLLVGLLIGLTGLLRFTRGCCGCLVLLFGIIIVLGGAVVLLAGNDVAWGERILSGLGAIVLGFLLVWFGRRLLRI